MIEKYIKYLLFEYDCVVIPDFGGFIANYVSADIHPIRHTFVPPSKNIAFNEMLKLNDGLLVAHIANNERISREQAQKAVKDFTDFVKEEIQRNKKYKFYEIGTLFLNHEQKLQFEPENKVNYLNNSFGLPELVYNPIERTSNYAKFKTKDRAAMLNQENTEEEELLLTPEPRRSRSWIWLAIFIPILLFLAGGAGYFLFLDNGNQALSSFNPFVSMHTSANKDTGPVDDSFLYPADSVTASEDTGEVSTDTDWPAITEPVVAEETSTGTEPEQPVTDFGTTSGFPTENTVTETTKESEKIVETTPKTTLSKTKAPEAETGFALPSSPPRYYVIVGGFAVKKNALKLRNNLINKGNDDAKLILPPADKNLLKVSVADYSTFQEAAAKADGLKSEFGNSVWVYKY